MTQVFREDGTVVPVTVVEAGPCKVTAVREHERDGYAAVQLAFGEVKEGKLTRAEEGHTKKAGAPPMRHLVEFRDEDLGGDDPIKIGDDVTVACFEAGQKVKVAGVSIGKGFQGGIKRHNFSRGPVSHGSHNVRAPGSIGASAFPARVFKGMRMPGQMGNKRITQKGLEIADVDAERNLLLIKGSVPGSEKGWVLVKDAVKKKPPDGLPYPAALRGEGAPGSDDAAEAMPEAAPEAAAEDSAP